MFLLSAILILLVVIAVGVPLVRLISRPLEASHPRLASGTRVTLWIAIALATTWPVASGPMLFSFKCDNLTRLDVEPPIDARINGYFDERLSMPAHIKTHFDEFFLDRDVEDLIVGRVSFFEKRHPSPHASVPYLRYSLADVGSPNCTPSVTGGSFGRSRLAKAAPMKCLAAEQVATVESRYLIAGSGDLNMGDGTTKVVDRSTNQVLAMFRSFGFSHLLSGTTTCPNLRVEGDAYGGHVIFTKMVFKDATGNVERAIRR